MIQTNLKNRFSNLLIVLVVILFISKIGFATESCERLPYRNFIEQNKTWWYNSAIFRGGFFDFYYFGIKIDGDTIIGDIQWSKCWLIDVEKNKMLPCPIALIREENKKIFRYIYDDELEDLRLEYYNNTDNAYLRNIFMSDVHSSRCSYESLNDWGFSFEDVLSSPDDYPLYDFSSETKHQIWPWSYLYVNEKSDEQQPDFEIPLIFKDEDGVAFQAHRMMSFYEINNKVTSESSWQNYIDEMPLIVEGVGIHRLNYDRCGTFLLPADRRYGITGYVWMPTLLMVTLNNDSEVYFRGRYGRDFSLDKAVQNEEIVEYQSASQTICDLMGREVKNPVPGSIYICNGRKIVWK